MRGVFTFYRSSLFYITKSATSESSIPLIALSLSVLTLLLPTLGLVFPLVIASLESKYPSATIRWTVAALATFVNLFAANLVSRQRKAWNIVDF